MYACSDSNIKTD